MSVYIHRTWEGFSRTVRESSYPFGDDYPYSILLDFSKKSKEKIEEKLGMKYEEALELTEAIEIMYMSIYRDNLINKFNEAIKNLDKAKEEIADKFENYINKKDISAANKQAVDDYINAVNTFIYKFENMDMEFFKLLKSFNKKDSYNLNELLNDNKIIYSNMSKASVTSLINLKLLLDDIKRKVDKVKINDPIIKKSVSTISFTKISKDKQKLIQSSTKYRNLFIKIQGYINNIMGAYFEYILKELLQRNIMIIKETMITGFITNEKNKQQKTDLLVKLINNMNINVSIKSGSIDKPFEGKIDKWKIHYYSSSVNSMLEEMAKNKIRFTDMYRYVIYNSLTQKYSPSFDAPKEVKNIFNTTNGSMQYISNIIRHIGAVYSPFAIGTDIDFVLYRDRYLPTFIILRDLASMISSSKYIMQIEYKFKYNDEFKKIMQKRRNIKDKQENIRLNQKLLDSYFKSIPIKYII